MSRRADSPLRKKSHAPTQRQRLYTQGRAALRRLRLAPRLDYHLCEVLLSQGPRTLPSDWDAASLWMGEAPAAWHSLLAELEPERAAFFPERWAQGHRCFAAVVDGRCVGYLWVSLGPKRIPGKAHGCVWSLPAGSAWLFDAFFHPLVLGTYPDLIRFVCAHLRTLGIDALLGQVEIDNRTSRRVHSMMGGECLGWVATLHLGPLRLHLDHPKVGGFHIRWGASPVRLAAFLPLVAKGNPAPPPFSPVSDAPRIPAPAPGRPRPVAGGTHSPSPR